MSHMTGDQEIRCWRAAREAEEDVPSPPSYPPAWPPCPSLPPGLHSEFKQYSAQVETYVHYLRPVQVGRPGGRGRGKARGFRWAFSGGMPIQ